MMAPAQHATPLDPKAACAPGDGLQRGHAAARWLHPDGRMDARLCAGPLFWLARLRACCCLAVHRRSRGRAVLMRELHAGGARQQAARCCLPPRCKGKALKSMHYCIGSCACELALALVLACFHTSTSNCTDLNIGTANRTSNSHRFSFCGARLACSLRTCKHPCPSEGGTWNISFACCQVPSSAMSQ